MTSNKHTIKSSLLITELGNEKFLKISNSDEIRPFFMNIVSDSNHWMFVSSNGGISAGRKNPELALFPYYSVDKIIESIENTGPRSIFRVKKEGQTYTWEPFTKRHSSEFHISRNLFKSLQGNKLVFEEVNHDLGLTFRYQWNTSKLYGFVRKAELINTSSAKLEIQLLDGIQNVMPYGISSDLQRFASNLGDAYKRSELESEVGLGIYSLSAMIVDRAEPSEALKANVVWSLGFDEPMHLLSSLQLDEFRKGRDLNPEQDIKGERGAYFIVSDVRLSAKETRTWKLVANVNQSQSDIINLVNSLKQNPELDEVIEQDILEGDQNLRQLVANADGLQLTGDPMQDARHFSNVLFNIMRGGIFDDAYRIEKEDFLNYLANANKELFEKNHSLFTDLDSVLQRDHLLKFAKDEGDPNLMRLTVEYLPLKFSRRHGDPSRPWNYFTINTVDENTGEKILDYEGNWRDLFQNWEALAHSYPAFIDGMIFKFLNTSTFDGYNPYRLTKSGFDYETIEPDNPWSYIGYWGDHQIIYLLKFLEFAEDYFPEMLHGYFSEEIFVYAAVPYIIKPYDQLLENPHDTIEFSEEWDEEINANRDKIGADGALLMLDDHRPYKVNMLEKLLATVLSKLSNFIPGAGIWMNTQRPEWNDANNALVGYGVSMVTLYYLRRFLAHFLKITAGIKQTEIRISTEQKEFFTRIKESFEEFKPLLGGDISDKDRKRILDRLGLAGSAFRENIYKYGFSGDKEAISITELNSFIRLSLEFIDHSIHSGRRDDELYHAYKLIESADTTLSYSHLDEMLEGQVAILSSGYLKSREVLSILDHLRSSSLYREDQNSYILYPNKDLPGFLHKNSIKENRVMASELLVQMLEDGYTRIIEQDVKGDYHFNAKLKNTRDLDQVLDELKQIKRYDPTAEEKDYIRALYEEVFNHRAFTGRSGTFFAYEGLGSIYWHMVSKLLLAVEECCLRSLEEGDEATSKRLIEHFYSIKEGIGVHKPPAQYGAFPTDPYSHTPLHRGAQQPGMTGQVKEDILASLGELGVFVKEGCLSFNPKMLKAEAFLNDKADFEFVGQDKETRRISTGKNTLCFSFCQVPVIYRIAEKASVTVELSNGESLDFSGHSIDKELSSSVFNRSSKVRTILVNLNESQLIK